eukprot:gene18388-24858_t
MAQHGDVDMADATAQASSPGTMTIKVKTMEPACYELLVERNMTVPALKQRLTQYVDAPLERQRIIFKGRGLRDDQTLSEIGIEDGDALHLVIRPIDAPPVGSQPGAIPPGAAHPPPGGAMPPAPAPPQAQPSVQILTALQIYTERLRTNALTPSLIPLATRNPEFLGSIDNLHSELTGIIRGILQDVELPADLRELYEASATDPIVWQVVLLADHEPEQSHGARGVFPGRLLVLGPPVYLGAR